MPKKSLVVIFALFALVAGNAASHPLDLGLLDLRVEGQGVSVKLDINPEAAGLLLGLPSEQVTAPAVESRAQALHAATLGSGDLTVGGKPCSWGDPRASLEGTAVRLTALATCPEPKGALSWRFPFLTGPKVPSTFQLMVKLEAGGHERVALAEAKRPFVELEVDKEPGFAQFVWMGVEHIGAAPSEWRSADGGLRLPDGIDHILFLIALILGGGTLMQLIATATGFTVGHSVTLALASLGIVSFPSRFIESAIALSIAYVAVEALFAKESRHRWKIALGFGLVHGFGFANAITELSLTRGGLVKALLGYNLGVELGQVALVAIAAPVLYWLRSRPKVGPYAVPVASLAIFLAGSYWFVERAFGL